MKCETVRGSAYWSLQLRSGGHSQSLGQRDLDCLQLRSVMKDEEIGDMLVICRWLARDRVSQISRETVRWGPTKRRVDWG